MSAWPSLGVEEVTAIPSRPATHPVPAGIARIEGIKCGGAALPIQGNTNGQRPSPRPTAISARSCPRQSTDH
ncbi:Hypothetical protein NTJ_04851 [Nesidiocoris tenuis]|uniref:Uncharacterized protein n=1 Tax=Nesidiocoris tenuis TaxID=355587 RepID=A0ABN7AJ00_9HEMI|nr:Hypothetical protein NTJ_04851 [Nesidiocoris tenuis]